MTNQLFMDRGIMFQVGTPMKGMGAWHWSYGQYLHDALVLLMVRMPGDGVKEAIKVQYTDVGRAFRLRKDTEQRLSGLSSPELDDKLNAAKQQARQRVRTESSRELAAAHDTPLMRPLAALLPRPPRVRSLVSTTFFCFLRHAGGRRGSHALWRGGRRGRQGRLALQGRRRRGGGRERRPPPLPQPRPLQGDARGILRVYAASLSTPQPLN